MLLGCACCFPCLRLLSMAALDASRSISSQLESFLSSPKFVLSWGFLIILRPLQSHSSKTTLVSRSQTTTKIFKNDSRFLSKLIYLPPHSPDFNPIEQTFHSIKAWLQ